MGDHLLLAKVVLGLAGAAFCAIFANKAVNAKLNHNRFNAIALGALIISRLAIFVMLYIVLGMIPQTDLAGYYYPQAQGILSGQMPYRDFQSSYGPLFPVIAAVPLLIWHSPKSIILLTIAFDVLSFYLWRKIITLTFGEQLSQLTAILYLLNPLVILTVPVEGLNQVWISCFLAGAILLLRKREWASGIVFGASVVCVKFLSLLFAPAYFITARKRINWTLGLAVLPLIAYGFMFLKGIDVLSPFKSESGDNTSGNIFYLLSLFSSTIYHSRVTNILTICVLSAVFLLAISSYRKSETNREKILVLLIALICFTFLFCSKKSYTTYLSMCLFPVCASVFMINRSRIQQGLFGLFSTIACVEPSLWFRFIQNKDLGEIWNAFSFHNPDSIRIVIFLIVDVTLISFYLWYGLRTLKLIRENTSSIRETISSAPV